MLNLKSAEKDLRNAFIQVADQIEVTPEKIEFFINRDIIRSIEKDRKRMARPLKRLKSYLMVSFPEYKITGRIKSLTSILGKYMQERTLLDTFGFKIIIPDTIGETEEERIEKCYQVQKWIEENFKIFENEYNDRIKNPKFTGYQDLKMVVEYFDLMVEFIIQTESMYKNSKSGSQSHKEAYPWKYHSAITTLAKKYKEKEI